MMRPLVAACLVLLLGGCGGGDDSGHEKQDYERAVRAAVAEARDAGGTPAALRTAGGKLRELEPPEEVAGPHRDLVAAFDAIAAADERGVQPPNEIVERLIDARQAFAERRYDIGVYGPLSGS
jgi:hypothetical protein